MCYGLGLWCLTPLSRTFQLYLGGPRNKGKTCINIEITELSVTRQNIAVRVLCTLKAL